MSPQSPAAVHELLAHYITAGDIDSLVALYEQEATLLLQPGLPASGKSAIKEALAGLLALRGNFQISTAKVVMATDLAILFSDWSLNASDSTGKPIRMGGTTCDVVRRQSDGRWLFVIDVPGGVASVKT